MPPSLHLFLKSKWQCESLSDVFWGLMHDPWAQLLCGRQPQEHSATMWMTTQSNFCTFKEKRAFPHPKSKGLPLVALLLEFPGLTALLVHSIPVQHSDLTQCITVVENKHIPGCLFHSILTVVNILPGSDQRGNLKLAGSGERHLQLAPSIHPAANCSECQASELSGVTVSDLPARPKPSP